MTANVDFQKPFEAVKSLMGLQAEAISKSVAQQQKTGEELSKFFQGEMEKAKILKTPEELIKFNVESNQALFELLKNQGEAFTAIATDAREAATEELMKLAK